MEGEQPHLRDLLNHGYWPLMTTGMILQASHPPPSKLPEAMYRMKKNAAQDTACLEGV